MTVVVAEGAVQTGGREKPLREAVHRAIKRIAGGAGPAPS